VWPSRIRNAIVRQYPAIREVGRTLLVEVSVTGVADSLGRSKVPDVLVNAVRERAMDHSGGSGVVALIGPWGSGKSWVLNRAASALEFEGDEKERIRVVRFNPWLYADEGALFAGFAHLLLYQLRRPLRRRHLRKLLELIGPSSKLGPVDLSSALGTIARWVGDEEVSAATIERSLSRALSRKALCVVVDDVDRLTSDELLVLFKLIRLLGNVPNLHYVLSYDENTVLALLKATTVGADDPIRARAYMEKMVERRLTVPPMTPLQVRERVVDPLLSHPGVAGFELDERSAERLEISLTRLVAPHITTARLGDRLVDAAKRLPKALHGEVDWADWVLVSSIRVIAPTMWSWVADHRDELLLDSDVLLQLEKREQPAIVISAAIRDLGYRGGIAQSLLDIVQTLFPKVNESPRIVFGQVSIEEAIRTRGIGAPAKFARYMWADLPPGDMPDQSIVQAIRAVRLDSQGRLRGDSDLAEMLDRDQESVFTLLNSNIGDQDVAWVALLKFLRSHCFDKDDEDDRIHRPRARSLAYRAFFSLTVGERDELFRLTEDRPYQWWELLRDLGPETLRPDMKADALPGLATLRRGAFDHVRRDLEAGDAPSLLDFSSLRKYWSLEHIDYVAARGFLRRQVTTGAGA
jgi:hypothetical protein